MLLSACRDVDFASPVPQYLYGQRRRCSEAEESHALARLSAGHPQAAEPDNAGAEQGSEMAGFGIRGERKGEVRADECKFCVTTVHRIAG
jgi:hypothetical protein